MSKSIVLSILLISIFIQSAYTIRIPLPPKKPDVPTVQSNSTQNNQKTIFHSYEIQVTLNKGSSASGKIKLKSSYLFIKTKKDDFVYEKKIPYKEIISIEPTLWSSRQLQSQKKSNETPYLFYPTQYKIINTKNEELIYEGRLPQFERFWLINNDGRTAVFAIFFDYWVINGRARYWYNNRSQHFNYNKTNPHPLCLKKITFKQDGNHPSENKKTE